MLLSATVSFKVNDRVTGPRGLGRVAFTRFMSDLGRPRVPYVCVDYGGDVGLYAEPVELVSKVEELV